MNSYTPQSSFIGTTRYVSDKKVLTESYGFDGDVAYVIGKTGEKFTIKESYSKYNHEWTKIEGSSSDSDSTSGKEITKVSELENDSNYQDETSVDNKISTSLESYAKTADVTTAIETAVEPYAKTEVMTAAIETAVGPYAKSEDVESKIAETKTSLTESINTVADKMVLPAPYVENGNVLYCNGYGVIIEKVDDNTNKAIYYQLESKKEIQFPANISVVAGAKNKNCDNTCVIMNSGNILQVYGGSAGKGNVGNATIIINGGSISDAITGGGMIFGLGNVDGNQKFTNHVGVTNIVINNTDNNVSLVYGGAYSHGTVGKANVVLNNGSAQYVTAAGSNGYTADASLTINNGKYHVVQGVNRGDTSDVHIVVNGGTIDNLYAGSESDKTCTANFIHSNVVLNGGKVTKLAAGYNGGADYNPAGYVTGSYKSGILTDESNATSMNFVKNDDVLKKTDDTVILDGKKITFAEDGTVHWENV